MSRTKEVWIDRFGNNPITRHFWEMEFINALCGGKKEEKSGKYLTDDEFNNLLK